MVEELAAPSFLTPFFRIPGSWQQQCRLLPRHGAAGALLFGVPLRRQRSLRGSSRGARTQRGALRSQWQIPPGKIAFLFCAKFIDKKRPMDFLRAIDAAASRGDPVHALLVGDGELRAECESFANRQKLPATFVGFLNQTQIPSAVRSERLLGSSFRLRRDVGTCGQRSDGLRPARRRE